MEPEFGTDPDQFEIHISDSESHSPEENVSIEHPENGVPSTGNHQNSDVLGHVQEEVEKKKTSELDLLRASLSDVVLTQSLQFSERRIDLGDGDTNVAAWGSAAVTDPSPAQPDLLMAAASPSMTQQMPGSASSQHSEIQLGDIAPDFEDAVDPPLLTSTLKAANEDSDDEFDFDMPASKVDNGKSVRFSGGSGLDEFARRAGDVAVAVDLQKEPDKPGLSEISGQHAVLSPSLPQMTDLEKEREKSVAVGVTLESGDGPGQRIDSRRDQFEDEEEKEDRRHIITSTAADWDNVETVEAGFTDAKREGAAELMSSVPPLRSFSDVWQHFRTMDHTAVKDKVVVTTEKKGFSGFVSRLFGPPRMNKDLHADRELVFCIAATAFENGDTEHIQSLQTIYRVLTGSRFNCPRYGSHWEEIGFQGRDPATDLRGTGMLALVQLVSFLQDEATAQLARDLYKLSLHPTQNFPFCVMCINICRITLQVLREGVLNRECNSQKKVMPVVNQFYAGTLLYLFRVWQQGKTISDSGFVIRDVENRAKKQSKDVLKDLHAYTTSKKSGAEAHPAFANMDPSEKMDENVNFFSVVKSENKTAAELY